MKTRSQEAQNHLQRVLIYATLIILTILSLIPFIIVFANATRSTEQIQQAVSLLPSTHFGQNWTLLFSKGFNAWQGFKNSFIIAAGSTILTVYFSSLTAYAFVAYDFALRKFAWGFILALLMIPGQIGMIGFYKLVASLNLLNSYIPLILPAIAAPSAVFFLKQYLDTVYQPEMVDAARIDGAGELKIFHRVVLPIMKPGIATISIFSFVGSWNNFLMPLILLNDKSKFTLPIMVQMLKTDIYRTEYGSMYLGVGLTIVPLLLIYLFLSRHIIGGVAAGGVKG